MRVNELFEFAPDEKPLRLMLVHKNTGKEVEVGDEVTDFRGEKAFVVGWAAPKKPASEGYIYTSDNPKDSMDDGSRSYVGVFDCEWINRTDRG